MSREPVYTTLPTVTPTDGRPETMPDQLRRIVAESGLSGYRLAAELGVCQTTVSAFLRGCIRLTEEHEEYMRQLFGLRLVAFGSDRLTRARMKPTNLKAGYRKRGKP